MTDPVLYVLAGPNGAGKTTFFERYLAPVTYLPFVNADIIAAERWPDDTLSHAYEAARLAVEERDRMISERASFVTETVFSHPSKLELLESAHLAGYLVTLHVIAVPVELSVARVANRIAHGGHEVPEQKIRERYERLWPYLVSAIGAVDQAFVYDNSRASKPFRRIAHYVSGRRVDDADWPAWMPAPLREA